VFDLRYVPYESGRIFFLADWQDFGSESGFFIKILPGKKILPVRSTKSRQKKIPAGIFWSARQEFPAGLPGKTVLPDC
jgi:hypothetical protein